MIDDRSYLLAIDTVGHHCGIAIMNSQDGSFIMKHVLLESNMHDAMLAEMIRTAMIEHKIMSRNISTIAVSAGPGSFTGLRIGMSFAKGWCADGKTTLISVPTFDAMIHALIHQNPMIKYETLCIAKRSHGDQWFIQLFDTISGKKKSEVSTVSQAQIDAYIDDSTLIIGDYTQKQTESLYQKYNNSDPEFIAQLGYLMMLRGETISPFIADSDYHATFIPTIKAQKS